MKDKIECLSDVMTWLIITGVQIISIFDKNGIFMQKNNTEFIF